MHFPFLQLFPLYLMTNTVRNPFPHLSFQSLVISIYNSSAFVKCFSIYIIAEIQAAKYSQYCAYSKRKYMPECFLDMYTNKFKTLKSDTFSFRTRMFREIPPNSYHVAGPKQKINLLTAHPNDNWLVAIPQTLASKVSSLSCVHLHAGWSLSLLSGTMASITVLSKLLWCLTPSHPPSLFSPNYCDV